jgi:hypothetical protein
MPNSKKDLAAMMAGQGTFLDKLQGAEPGALNISFRFRDSLSNALRKSKESRYQIAARMSELTGSDISKTMLDAYTADSKEYHRFAAEWVPAFRAATGSLEPLIVLADACNCQVLSGDEMLYAEWARLERQKEEITTKQAIIKSKLPRRDKQ